MARKKNRRVDDDSPDEKETKGASTQLESSASQNASMSRKEKLKLKRAAKQQQAERTEQSPDNSNKSDDEDPYESNVSSLSKKKGKSKNSRNKKAPNASFAALDDSDSGQDSDEQNEKSVEVKDEEVVHAELVPEIITEKTTAKPKKSKKKFISSELFFDDAESKAEKGIAESVKDKKKKSKKAKSVLFQDDPESITHEDTSIDEIECIKNDKDSKRLSNKDRKKLKEAKERQEREDEYHRASNPLDGSQFAVSQQSFNEDATWENATDIHIDDFTINAHNKLLFNNASLNINHGGKYGLVGPNGQGKTTLLKMIALKELKIPPKIDCLYVEQEVVADDTRAVDAVLKADTERWVLLEEETNLLQQLANKSDPALDDRLNEVYEQLASCDASAAEARARRILHGLGFDSDMQQKATKDFSGGWRMRISLAKALYVEPTLLMLDEPTNHLDLNAVIWLDDYLQKWKKTLLIVSHDADFLNSVCTEILHLEHRRLAYYKGNYDQFREMEKQKRKQMEKAWDKQQKQLRSLKASGKSSKKATEIVKKKREPGARSAKKKNAESVGSALESAEPTDLLERPREYIVKFSFPETTQISPPILEVREVSFRYNEHTPYLFKGTDFGIDLDSRVCIVGPNGVGKSTILKIMTGEIHVTEGEVRRNPRVRIGVYNQHFVDKLPMGETPVEYLRRLFQDQSYQQARNLLGKVGLEGHAHEIKNRLLSGGQKARVVIAELILMQPHMLILDEPTNNLDIESIDALCDAINEYDGGVVIVTHDARLIESTRCLLWVVGDQDVVQFEGNFSGYRQSILDDLAKKAVVEEERMQQRALKKAEARDNAKSKVRGL